MRRRRTPNRFGILLDRLLAVHAVSGLELCRRTGTPSTTLINLKHRPPTRVSCEEMLGRWADAIGLSRAEQEALFEAAQLSFAPAWVQQLVDQLRGQLASKPPAPPAKRRGR